MDVDELRGWIVSELEQAVRSHAEREDRDARSWQAGHHDGYVHALTRLWDHIGADRSQLNERLAALDVTPTEWPSYDEDHI